MIGDRLKLKRKANQYTLMDLVNALEKVGITVTKGTLSNYETGRVIPSDSMLKALALELGTGIEFLKADNPPIPQICFLTEQHQTNKEAEDLEAYVHVLLEKRIDIDHILGLRSRWQVPKKQHIEHGQWDIVEERSEEIRKSWGLDQYPISSVINVLEKQEWDVFELPPSFGLSGVCGYDARYSIPFVYCATRAGVVNYRMQLLQEIACAYFIADTEEDMKEIGKRFAGSILFTRHQAVQEFGAKRNTVSSQELTIMKQKYGINKYEVMRRLEQLGIISNALYRNYMNKIREHSYPSIRDTMSEPLFFYENSSEYNHKIQLAYALGRISSEELARSQMLSRIYTE